MCGSEESVYIARTVYNNESTPKWGGVNTNTTQTYDTAWAKGEREGRGEGGEREGRGRGEGGEREGRGRGEGGTGGEIGGEGQRKEEGTGGRGRSSTYSDLSWETDGRLHKGQWEPKRQGALQRENGKEGRNSINMRKDLKYYQVHVWVWSDVLSACPQWWMYCIKQVVCTCEDVYMYHG